MLVTDGSSFVEEVRAGTPQKLLRRNEGRKITRKKKQTEVSQGRKEGMQQKGGNIFCACFFCLLLQETNSLQ
jgi:hypothetical protein